MDKRHILNEIKRTAEQNNGKPLGRGSFCKETGIRNADWEGKRWARWGDALIEAGYKPNAFQVAYEDDYLVEKMISLIRELGKYPADPELRLKKQRDKDFPSHTIFTERGGKADFAKKIIGYCADKEGYDDVVEICRPIADDARHEPVSMKKGESVAGYVYLLKSGRSYKIGRTNSPGRRKYELGIQLPDKPKEVHVIKTDDPVDRGVLA